MLFPKKKQTFAFAVFLRVHALAFKFRRDLRSVPSLWEGDACF